MNIHTTPYNQAEEKSFKSYCKDILFITLILILYIVNILIPIKYIFLILVQVFLIKTDGGSDYGPLYKHMILIILIVFGPLIGLLAPSIWDIIIVPVYYIILVAFSPLIYLIYTRCCC
jgi:hypothetical protein